MHRKFLVAPLVVALAACVLFAIPWAFGWTNQPRDNQPADASSGGGFLLPSTPRILSVSNEQANDQYRAALEKKVAWEFKELPLREVLTHVQADLGIQVVIDERALADASIGTDTLINCPLDERSARAALKDLLANHGLAFVPGDECLLITTKEEAELRLETRIYPVLDLVQAYDDQGAFHDYDTLVESIMASVQTDSWNDFGGQGMIEPFPASGAVVISQTEDAHREVERLLTLLRQTRRDQGLRGPYKSTKPSQLQGSFGGVGGPAGGGGMGSSGAGGMSGGGGFF